MHPTFNGVYFRRKDVACPVHNRLNTLYYWVEVFRSSTNSSGGVMSIRCVCPNGHPLTVSESLAGKSGLCPLCRAPVRVPQKEVQDVSEEAILDMLRPQAPLGKASAVSA